VIVALIALVIAAVTIRVFAIAVVLAGGFGHCGRRRHQGESDKRCGNMLQHRSSLIAGRCNSILVAILAAAA
jgi:hypothetical protein